MQKSQMEQKESIEMHIIVRIERFLKKNGLSATSFGRAVARDPRLVHDMRRGREPGHKMLSKLESYLAGAQS